MEEKLLGEIKELLEEILAEIRKLREKLEAAPKQEVTALASRSIRYLGLSNRVFNALCRHFRRVPNIEEIVQLSPRELLEISRIGEKSLQELVDKLAQKGFSPREE